MAWPPFLAQSIVKAAIFEYICRSFVPTMEDILGDLDVFIEYLQMVESWNEMHLLHQTYVPSSSTCEVFRS